MSGPAGAGARRRAIWIVAGTLLVAGFLFVWFRAVFVPLLAALAIAYAVEPIVQALSRRGLRRGAAVGIVFVGVLAALLASAVTLGAQLLDLLAAILAPDGLLQRGIAAAGGLLERLLGEGFGERISGAAAERLRELQNPVSMREALAPVLAVGRGVADSLLSLLGLFGLVLLLPVYLVHWMLLLPRLWDWCLLHLPAAGREQHLGVVRVVHAGMSAFLRGFVIVALLKGTFLGLGLWLLGVPFAPVVGLASGALTIVPFVGPLLGGVGAALLLLSEQAAVTPLLWLVALYVAGEALEGLVLTPLVMRQGVGLHPLAVLFSVIFWSAALGVLGALVAIPLTIVLRAALRAYVLPSLETISRPRA
jgi:predicted PurR-regulated permease PerM